VGILGCGQFAFSTIGHAITSQFGNRFVDCFDIDREAEDTFARFFRIVEPAPSAQALISNPRVRYLYVASNHASHAEYAAAALRQGKHVYLEKPICVSEDQLRLLVEALTDTSGLVYAGYNRPFSRAIRILSKYIPNARSPVTLSCFVIGHAIRSDHWYRKPSEGTRICGNVGHWLDLMVHLLSKRELADQWTISLAFSDSDVRDDNLAISLTSAVGDLVNIVLSARGEPFEGISETICYQCGDVIGKIDDFRKLVVWQSAKKATFAIWPKDVGHDNALLQPFAGYEKQRWDEVILSSLLMLAVKDMVERGQLRRSFSFSSEYERVLGLPKERVASTSGSSTHS